MPTFTNGTVAVSPLGPTVQYLYGDAKPRLVTVASAQVVTKGDLIALDASGSGAGGATTAIRAEDEAWVSDLATSQGNFVKYFIGVAAQSKRSTDTKPYGNSVDNQMTVQAGGIYEFPCASGTFEVGDMVGPKKASGNALVSQAVVKVTTEAASIGRVVERGTSVTSVKVEITPRLLGQRFTLPVQA